MHTHLHTRTQTHAKKFCPQEINSVNILSSENEISLSHFLLGLSPPSTWTLLVIINVLFLTVGQLWRWRHNWSRKLFRTFAVELIKQIAPIIICPARILTTCNSIGKLGLFWSCRHWCVEIRELTLILKGKYQCGWPPCPYWLGINCFKKSWEFFFIFKTT